MIDEARLVEARRLLAEGRLSQRRIAQLTGISRGTVSTIARGRRPNYDELRQQRSLKNPWRDRPPRRCPGCGGLVFMPCRLCRIRAEDQRRRALKRFRRLWAAGQVAAAPSEG